MIPLKDDNPTSGKPIVSYGIIGFCVLIFLAQLGLSEEEIKENEELWRAENNYDKYAPQDPKNADLRNLGVRPNDPMAVNPGMDIPQGDLPPLAPGEEDLLNTVEGGVNVPPMTNTTDQG